MSAPLFDAVTAHAKKQKVSMHMPAHKGKFPRSAAYRILI